MIIKHQELVVDSENPFKNDKLNRAESAKALTEFVTSTQEPLVICIDAPWGQGKTTFLRMWQQELENNAVPTIYFNAWANDFTDDAFISLVGEVSNAIEVFSEKNPQSKAKEYLDKTKKYGAALVKRALPVAAKIMTAGALDIDKVTEQALATFAETVAKEELANYEKSKNSLGSFRTALESLAASVTSEDDPKPLVFIIDELDRCRPNFAIEILEKAKHFFNVPNIVFVLGADKTQLGQAMTVVYGKNLNVNGYLRRFIDVDYLLPPVEKAQFLEALFGKFGFEDYFAQKSGKGKEERNVSLEVLAMLCDKFELTLREQEHCCSLLSMAIRTTPNNYKLYPVLLCYLIVLKVKVPDMYKGFMDNKVSARAVYEQFSSKYDADELLHNHLGAVIEAYVMSCNCSYRQGQELISSYENIARKEDLTTGERERADKIKGMLKQLEYNDETNLLPLVYKKIEIASRFKQ